MNQEALAEAVKIAGNQGALAELIGKTQQAVSLMVRGKTRISAETAIAVERATNGRVPKWKLRPDIFERPRRRATA